MIFMSLYEKSRKIMWLLKGNLGSIFGPTGLAGWNLIITVTALAAWLHWCHRVIVLSPYFPFELMIFDITDYTLNTI